MAFIGLYKFDLALRNEGIRWSFIRWARKVLQINFEECRTVLIHTSDKRPSHSHCYQANDCQVLLLKGGQYFCTEKKYVPPFSTTKNIFISKRRNVSFVSENTFNFLLLKSYYCNHLLNNND